MGMTLELPYNYQVSFRPNGHAHLVFQLTAEHALDFAARLKNLQGAREVIFRLAPQNEASWVLYWKLKDTDSRAIMAHPESTEWVGTLALEQSVIDQFIKALESKSPTALSKLCRLTGFSNLQVEVSFID